MKTYVFTDIHGMGDHFNAIIDSIEIRSNNDYQIFYLGDACDRGPDGYRIMNYLVNNSRITYLKGNHEDMFVKACLAFYCIADESGYSAKEYAKMIDCDIMEAYFDDDIRLSINNGGRYTLNSWLKDGCPAKIIGKINGLPHKASWVRPESGTVYDMCHAGCLEYEWVEDDIESMIWSRTHFSALWEPDWDDNRHILIHGHTPTFHLAEYADDVDFDTCADHEVAIYADGTKIDLDTAVFHSDRAWVLDLNTLEVIEFGRKEE